jgi:NADH-quinone oxidoreductase subunit M
MLKVGTFGFVRYLLGLLPELSIAAARPVSALAVASIFFAAICSITERDAKRLVALTSISHMGMVILALFMFGPHAFFGAVYLMVGHGVTSTALFYLIGILYDRFHTRDLSVLGGLVSVMPLYCSALFFFAMANAGFPWSLSFVGEFHIFVGLAQSLSL